MGGATAEQNQHDLKQEAMNKSESNLRPEYADTLLANFSLAQKEYIVKHLYPELVKALVHFISEAKRHNQIIEREGQKDNESAHGMS